jgi:C4-type Zn-finger protein
MMRNVTLLWIEAGKLLADNPAALVSCPVCAKDHLHVKDSRSAENPNVVEREMSCSSCGARNYLRLVRPLDS